MRNTKHNINVDATAARRRWQTILLSLVIVLGLGSVAGLNRWIELNRPPADSKVEEEKLYVTGSAARRMSLGFNGLIADWYWMRSLQYVGRKIIAKEGTFQMDDLASLDLKLLYPLLDTATTLDPQFLAVYEYGGVVLPAINDEDAIKLLKKGIEKNPEAWRLYHQLGYIYWQRKDYKTASETYAEGARIKGAPAWMQAMSARMLAEGGSSATAREMYKRIKEQSDDADIRHMADLRLLQIDSFEERDAIRRVLADYSAQRGRCPSNWREIAQALQGAGLTLNSEGAPLDPANTPYVLVQTGCDVDLDPTSSVPYK